MSRQLVIMRHGSAAISAPSDVLRPLLKQGEDEVHSACGHFPFYPAVIYHSSLLRAKQTAAILSSYYPKARLVEVDWLTPESRPQKVLTLLPPDVQCAALVSHQPLVSSLAALLIEGSERYAAHIPYLDTANFFHIQAEVFEAGCADLVNTYKG